MARAKPRGWWYPWIFVVGMLVVIAVNAVMISYAIGTFPGLDTEDAYRKGIDYNQTLAAARLQAARGWRADVDFTPAAENRGTGEAGELQIRLVDVSGQPLRGLVVSAALMRPTRGGLDQHVLLEERAGGIYAASVVVPLAGQWDTHIWARRGDDDDAWQATRRIIIR